MLATFLVHYPWITPLSLLGFVVVSPFLGQWLLPRRRLTGALGVAATVAVLALVFIPTGRELTVRCVVEWALPFPRAVEPFANVVLFVPLAYLGALLSRRPAVAGGVAIGASALIEATQAVLPILGRSCSTGDWLANSIGALIGAGLGWVALSLAKRKGMAMAAARRPADTRES
ncbi:VanZ family protein [Leucobacter komagatae]|uniref:VanZ family protein n=1 Tax=Leucobacter komagatae TaxID=55969 RepID=UPI000695DC93|nr:VanZ family protein [Leucobacter komagatae]